MPYKFQTDKIKLPREYDRRVKITEIQKAKVKELYQSGFAIRVIARQMPFSRRSIQYILFPERLLKVKQQFKDRGQSAISRAKTKGKRWAETMREHRRYKVKVVRILKLK